MASGEPDVSISTAPQEHLPDSFIRESSRCKARTGIIRSTECLGRRRPFLVPTRHNAPDACGSSHSPLIGGRRASRDPLTGKGTARDGKHGYIFKVLFG